MSRTTSAAKSDAARAAPGARAGIRTESCGPRVVHRDRMTAAARQPRRALVAREPLDGPYVLLTFRHAEVARAARAGPVRDDQGRHLRRAAAAPAVLDPRPSIPGAETFRLFLKTIGAGHARAGRRCAPASSRSAWARWAGRSPRRRPGTRRSSSPAATASRPSISSASELRARGAAGARLLRRAHRRRPADPRRRSRALGVPLVADDRRRQPRPSRARHGAARRVPRRARRRRSRSTPAGRTRCCTRWRAWPRGAACPRR